MSQNHSDDLLETPAPDFSIDDARDIAERVYGLSGDFKQLTSERDQNFRVTTASGDQWVLKIANSAEDRSLIDMQLRGVEHIARVDPGLPVPEVLLTRDGQAIARIEAGDGTAHDVRTVSYVPGVNPPETPPPAELLRPMGATLARLGKAMRGFFHPAAGHEIQWDLKHALRLRQYLHYVEDAGHRKQVAYFLDRFEAHVAPAIPALRAQIVHNDFVPDNMLVDPDDASQIVGIIDFGDMAHTALIIDLATCAARMLNKQDDPVWAACEIAAAYHAVLPLEAAELRVLYDLIAARLITLNVIAAWRAALHPENTEYITSGVDETWETISTWQALDPDAVTARFLRVGGHWEFSAALDASTQDTGETMLERRARLLGPVAELFYDRPVHIVRGEGVWLYDADGRRYLDVYNNVAQVGHGHPHVAGAIARQQRVLNTNTRYLHDHILDLAERITSRMPDGLSVCTFVCTGSEANELAWQLSKHATGNSGALITHFAYHGSTDATKQFSTESTGRDHLPPHVRTFNPPTSEDALRDPGVDAAIAALTGNGHPPAMLITDTGFVSDGMYTSPPGYLSRLADEVRAAGGLYVADEVQPGFGRLGEHFWGFQFDEVVPDIVTMGKPMGNGHPIAAVVTRPDIAEALARTVGYFNTFGGNPVACAAGLAVLDVIEQEGLQENARVVGAYLKMRLEGLQADYPMIGPVHGSGLAIGVDIVGADGALDADAAHRLMNHMREHGVLIGVTGESAAVLKLRPPIVFTQEHAQILVEALVGALNAE